MNLSLTDKLKLYHVWLRLKHAWLNFQQLLHGEELTPWRGATKLWKKGSDR